MKRDEKRDLLYRHWECSSPRIVMLLVHGLGGHSNNWEHMSNYLLERGISSYAIELKGFGQTPTLKGHIDSMNTYVKDVRRLYNVIKKEHKKSPIFIAGESMGGLISFLTVIKRPNLFRGMVCMSPGFASRLKFSFLEYVKMIAARFYNPRKQFVMPFTSAMCTSDLECQKYIDNDTLEHRFATPKLLESILLGQLSSVFLKHKVKTDTLFLLAGDDTFVSSEASKKIFNGMKLKNKEMIEYPGKRHSLTVEIERDRVFGDLLKWMEKRT